MFELKSSKTINHVVLVVAFFSIPKTFGLVWKSSLVSCTHYTFPKIGECIITKLYNKLNLGIVFVPNFTTT